MDAAALTLSAPLPSAVDAGAERRITFLSTKPADPGERRLAFAAILVSCLIFGAAAPFAKLPLAQVPAFLPLYQSALVVSDLITAVLLFGQYRILRWKALLLLAAAYLFSALMAVSHGLSFPGLFAPTGLFSSGGQTTAWIYFLWHACFPLMVIAYALLANREGGRARGRSGLLAPLVIACGGAVLAAVGLTVLAVVGLENLPPLMQGNRDAPAKIYVATLSWMAALFALPVLWRRRPQTVLDLWLMVVMCVWIFDVALAAVLNAGRYDLGWYAGRVYGFLAGSFVLAVLLLENGRLYAELARAREAEGLRAREAQARHDERLRIMHEIDRAIVGREAPEKIAGAVIQPLRALLDVPRAIVNIFDLDKGEVEWLAAAGRHRTRVGGGVRYSIRMMGDVEALRRGESQVLDTRALPDGPEVQALLASGVRYYMAVPMLSGGELIGALSFGGEHADFEPGQVAVAREIATQLAIVMSQARLIDRIKQHADELERRVQERTAELRAMNRELNDLYDNAPCGYHSVDAEGRIVRINRTWLSWLGLERDQALGRRHSDFMTAASAERFRNEVFPRFMAEGKLDDVEFEYQRSDGSVMFGLLNSTAIRDAEGRYVTSRSIVYDATERKLAGNRIRSLNAELERKAGELTDANRELESFSYSVSHDLRSPLRAVSGYALMLAEDYADRLDAEARRLLEQIRQSAAQMDTLINDLLKFSRAGRGQLAANPLDMEALARGVAAELSPDYPRARIDVGALPPSMGDGTLMRQVWTNLISNALKYSGRAEAPRVEIGGRRDGAEACYWVRDNGAGFDMRYQEKLFKVFQRLHGPEEFEGTGVGLAIVQRVVVRHGGRIWAEGKVGEGACFHFTLPVAA